MLGAVDLGAAVGEVIELNVKPAVGTAVLDGAVEMAAIVVAATDATGNIGDAAVKPNEKPPALGLACGVAAPKAAAAVIFVPIAAEYEGSPVEVNDAGDVADKFGGGPEKPLLTKSLQR